MILRAFPALMAGCLLLLCPLGAPATSPSVQYLLASETEPDPGGLPDGWSAVDHNGDGMTWNVSNWGGLRGNPAKQLRFVPLNGADDELRSMTFNMQEGQEAALTFELRMEALGVPGASLVCRLAPVGDPGDVLPPVEIGAVTPVPYGWYQSYAFPFVAPETGQYRFEFHATVPVDSANNQIGVIYLDRIRVQAPEEDLELVLQLDEQVFSRGGHPPVYPPDDPIRVMVYIRNNGPEMVRLNGRLALDDLNHPEGVLGFEITTPDGTVLPFEGHVRRASPSPDDFVAVEPGEIVFKFQEVNQGYYNMAEPGEYAMTAKYQNQHKAGTRFDGWLGMLVSNTVSFTIEPERPDEEDEP